MAEFNPREIEAYSDLPESEKLKFKEVEGGGFVRKEAEEDLEVSHRMGLVGDQIITALRQDLEARGISEEDALAAYNESASKGDEKNFTIFAELLKQYADLKLLSSGTDSDESLKTIFGDKVSLGYSQKTQALILERIDPRDTEVITRMLVDNRFTNKEDLVKLIGIESDVQTIYDLVKARDLDLATLLVGQSKEKDFKIHALKELLAIIDSIVYPTKSFARFYKSQIEQSVGEYLTTSGNHADAIDLLDKGLLNLDSFLPYLHKIESDDALYELAVRNDSLVDVFGMFKYIADPAISEKITKTQAAEFKNLSDEDKAYLVIISGRYFNAINSEPKISEANRLTEGGDNKFVSCINQRGEARYFISWSPMSTHPNHSDILKILRLEGPIGVGGGYINLVVENGKTIVTFSSSSGIFGKYGFKVLERFRPQITEALKKSLAKEEIELRIEISK